MVRGFQEGPVKVAATLKHYLVQHSLEERTARRPTSQSDNFERFSCRPSHKPWRREP